MESNPWNLDHTDKGGIRPYAPEESTLGASRMPCVEASWRSDLKRSDPAGWPAPSVCLNLQIENLGEDIGIPPPRCADMITSLVADPPPRPCDAGASSEMKDDPRFPPKPRRNQQPHPPAGIPSFRTCIILSCGFPKHMSCTHKPGVHRIHALGCH